MDEVPDRAIIDLKAPLGKLGNQPTYCEVLLPDPLQKPLAMLTGNRFWLVATHLAGGNAAGLAHPPHPIDHRTDAQTKLRRRPVARQPTLLNRRDYTLTKIKRIWSAHRMLASNPASILNQNQPDLGIPIRFRLKSSRFSCRSVRLMSWEPKPGFQGSETCGPPRSIQLTLTCFPSSNHVTSIAPRADDSAPCLTAFVTNSWAIKANPLPALADSTIGPPIMVTRDVP